MTKRYFISALVLLLGISVSAKAATDLVPSPPKIAAKAYILLDEKSGRILAESNSGARIEPASLTKLMTAYAVFREIRNGGVTLEENARVSKKAWQMKGSRMFIEVGKSVPVKDLLMGMIVQSGNDASVALAEHIGGSEDAFVTLMNRHAENLGMVGTHFTNSTGWPEKDHYTNVKDLSILTQALIREFPEYYAWYSIKEFTFNNIRQSNRNRLLWIDDRVDGVKTGHTESAGYCLITSAKQKTMRLISVIVGTKSEEARVTTTRKLLNYGFRFYDTFQLYAANKMLTKMRIWKGEIEELPLGLNDGLFVTLPKGQKGKLDASMSVDQEIMAPAFRGKQYGTVDVKLGDKIIASRPLVALKDVPEGGLWQRLIDSISLLFN